MSFQREAQEGKEGLMNIKRAPFEHVQHDMVSVVHQFCAWLAQLLLIAESGDRATFTRADFAVISAR